MAGVREDGILQTSGGSGSVPVDATIVAPLPLPVTSAFTTLLQAKNFPADSPVTLDVSELSSLMVQFVHVGGLLSQPTVEATVDGTNWILPLVNYWSEIDGSYLTAVGSLVNYGLNFLNVVDILQIRITAGVGATELLTIYGTNVVHPETVKQTRITGGDGLFAGVTNSAPVVGEQGLIVRQVGISDIAALADNTVNPSLGGIQTFPMVYDGVIWDRLRGDSTGLLVQGLTPVTLADNLPNPTIPTVGSFGMVFNGTFWQRMPGNSTDGVKVAQGTGGSLASPWPISITDGTNIADVCADNELNVAARALMVGGYDRANGRMFPLPVLQANFTVPTINDLAIPVDNRLTAGLQNSAAPRNNFLLVGGRSNTAVPLGQQFAFSGEQFNGIDPTVTMGAVTREYGQQYINSGNISLVGTRFTISSRYIVKATAIFNLSEGNPFQGIIKPVISIDNGVTWSYCLGVNITTGANFSELSTGNINGSYVIPAGNGATDFGFEITARTTGDILFKVSSNTIGLGALFAMTSPIGNTPISALVSDTPASYLPDTSQPISLTSEGRLRVSSVDSYLDRVWSTFNDNPWNLPATVGSLSAWN